MRVERVAWGDAGEFETPVLSVEEIASLMHVVAPDAPGVAAPRLSLTELRTLVLGQRERFLGDKAAGRPWSAERIRAMQEATLECYAEVLPIWTTGYAGWPSWTALDAAMKRDEPLLVDIRLNPWSETVDYRQATLERRLGDHYLHLGEWGNLNYKRGPIKIADFGAGLRRLVAATPLRSVVLMCGCLVYGGCHRCEVARQLTGVGWEKVQEYSLKTYPARQAVVTTARTWKEERAHIALYREAVAERERTLRA